MPNVFKRTLLLFLAFLCITGVAFTISVIRPTLTPSSVYAASAGPPTSGALSVYVGSNDGYLYSLNASTGALHWRYNTGSSVTYGPAVNGGVVYVPSADSISALNASNGSLLWIYTTGGTAYAPAVNNGVAYFDSGDGFLYALNATDGSFIWRSLVGSNSYGDYKPAISNGVVYDSAAGSLYAFNASNGSLIWVIFTGSGGAVSTAPTVFNNVVYFGDLGCFDLANAADGSLITAICSEPVYSPPTVANGLVYFAFLKGSSCCARVEAMDISTHAIVWSTTTIGPDFSKAAVQGGVVFAGAGQSVYALNATTGTKNWARFLGSTIGTAGTVTPANGLVYVGAANGTVYALSQSSKTGQIIWTHVTGGAITGSPVVA
jgi:eukaryotic-like serine/threonine-protein kinase